MNGTSANGVIASVNVSPSTGTPKILVDSAELIVTQHGKECHDRCATYEQAGTCMMPSEGVCARVESPGVVIPGDPARATREGEVA